MDSSRTWRIPRPEQAEAEPPDTCKRPKKPRSPPLAAHLSLHAGCDAARANSRARINRGEVNVPNSSFSHTMTERGFTRFVLLRPREAPCPPPLADALRERWSHVHQVENPLGALAELCVLERMEHPRRAYGLPPSERIALIVLERNAWNDLSDLLRTVRDRLPEVSVWVHTGELLLEVSNPPRADQPDARTPPESGTATRGSARKGFGALKLAGSWMEDPEQKDPRGAPTAEEPPHNPGETARTETDLEESGFEEDLKDHSPRTVSPEELEMLLERDDEDEAPPHTGSDEDVHP